MIAETVNANKVSVYQNSMDHLERALKSIPTGAQTFSKSYYSLPLGGAPLYAQSAKGAIITDVDGNEYIDLINGLLAISLGYQDPDVDRAIQDQMKQGISFSLPHPSEVTLAEKLIEIIPCAEMVRFGKNGTDVTSAAIRLARAYTGKNRVMVGGYHGWQDWSIGLTSRNLGVPSVVSNLSSAFTYNDLDSVNQLIKESSDWAAIILEPMTFEPPKLGFLEGLKEICDQHNIVLIFDEMITGFRFSIGGAQSQYGVTPDLATFGKGLGNGMPISAIVGKAEIMEYMEEIFFSGTHGGEALSISSALAVINKMEREPVLDAIHSMGSSLRDCINNYLVEQNISWLRLVGHPSWLRFSICLEKDAPLINTIIIQELSKRGILTIGTLNFSYASTKVNQELMFNSIIEVIELIHHKIDDLNQLLKCNMPKGVFKVRK